MSPNGKASPGAVFSAERRWMAGIGRPPWRRSSIHWFAFGPLRLLLTILPFLLAHGMTGPGRPTSDSARTDAPRLAAPIAGPSDNEQDVCNPAPLDPDPSDDETGMALYLDAHTRKDKGLISVPTAVSFLFPTAIESPISFPAAAMRRAGEPERPYFLAYPVYLIGDLPPPTA